MLDDLAVLQPEDVDDSVASRLRRVLPVHMQHDIIAIAA